MIKPMCPAIRCVPLLTGLLSIAAPALAATDAALPAAIQTLDADHDGSLDLAEAKAGAARRFAALDSDHDGRLDATEAAAARVHHRGFEHSDANADHALDEAEYLKLVERRFAAADGDHDGSVDGDEFRRKHGKALRRLIE